MFRKALNSHFWPKTRYRVLALSQVEISIYGDFGQLRGRGFVALAQVFGRTAKSFLRKHILPAANRVSADLFAFAVPETARAVSGGTKIRTAAKNVGRQFLRKQLGNGSGKQKAISDLRQATRVIRNKSAKETCRSRRHIHKNFSHWSCRTVFGTNLFRSFCESLRKSPSSSRRLVVPPTGSIF